MLTVQSNRPPPDELFEEPYLSKFTAHWMEGKRAIALIGKPSKIWLSVSAKQEQLQGIFQQRVQELKAAVATMTWAVDVNKDSPTEYKFTVGPINTKHLAYPWVEDQLKVTFRVLTGISNEVPSVKLKLYHIGRREYDYVTHDNTKSAAIDMGGLTNYHPNTDNYDVNKIWRERVVSDTDRFVRRLYRSYRSDFASNRFRDLSTDLAEDIKPQLMLALKSVQDVFAGNKFTVQVYTPGASKTFAHVRFLIKNNFLIDNGFSVTAFGENQKDKNTYTAIYWDTRFNNIGVQANINAFNIALDYRPATTEEILKVRKRQSEKLDKIVNALRPMDAATTTEALPKHKDPTDLMDAILAQKRSNPALWPGF